MPPPATVPPVARTIPLHQDYSSAPNGPTPVRSFRRSWKLSAT